MPPPPRIPELEALAQVLCQARQSQGLSLEELAARLHMGVEQLRAHETADLTRLPEPVFVVAQARRIADALNVDVDNEIASLRGNVAFSALMPVLSAEVFQQAALQADCAATTDSAQGSVAAASRPLAERGPRPRLWPRLRLWWLLPLLLVGGASAAAVLLVQQPSLWRGLKLAGAPPASVPALAPAPPAAMPARPVVKAPVELLIRSSQPSWLTVRPLDGGQPLFFGNFVGERRFPLGAGLQLRAGRPDLVLVSQGTAAPRPLGTISDIRWVVFRPAGLAKPAPLKPPAARQRQPGSL